MPPSLLSLSLSLLPSPSLYLRPVGFYLKGEGGLVDLRSGWCLSFTRKQPSLSFSLSLSLSLSLSPHQRNKCIPRTGSSNVGKSLQGFLFNLISTSTLISSAITSSVRAMIIHLDKLLALSRNRIIKLYEGRLGTTEHPL